MPATQNLHTTNNTLSLQEMQIRQERCQKNLLALCPEADGLLVFHRPTIYYLSGTLGKGMLWLPKKGEALLFIRKGLERAKLESPHIPAVNYRSFREVPKMLAGPAGKGQRIHTIAVDKSFVPWDMAERLQKTMPDINFVNGDIAIRRSRAVKTPLEIQIMRVAGKAHHTILSSLLPARIHPGMTELKIANIYMNLCMEMGHNTPLRMSAFGEELYMGAVSAGANGAYPSYYDGPVGLKGAHPASPFWGNADVVWEKNSLLTIDMGFGYNGYSTDKTSIYFSGPQNALPTLAKEAQTCCQEIENALAKRLKPGAIPCELWAASQKMAEQAGFADGYMGTGGNRVAFVGHGIGLCIDEWPVLASRFDTPLEEGMVIALEPKITLPNHACRAEQALAMVGTENTYVVTPSGGQSLTGPAENIICVG